MDCIFRALNTINQSRTSPAALMTTMTVIPSLLAPNVDFKAGAFLGLTTLQELDQPEILSHLY